MKDFEFQCHKVAVQKRTGANLEHKKTGHYTNHWVHEIRVKVVRNDE